MAHAAPRVTVLCGGVGGSRFVRALTTAVPPEQITAIINTADDDQFHGLYISPDPDIVTYALAGLVDEERGWGLRGDTFRWLEQIAKYAHDTWFQIGDRDLATHLHRTRLRAEGHPLSQIMADIARAFDVPVRLLPMSDDPVRTVVETDSGELPFQRYLVQRHAKDAVRGVRFEGAAEARPAPGVLEAIAEADAVLIAPSNPIASIWPILAIAGVRDAVAARRPRVTAISPIVGGRSLQPPAGEMMSGLGLAVDVLGVADAYGGVISRIVIDRTDGKHARALAERGLGVLVQQTIMHEATSTAAFAQAAISFALS